MLYAYFCDKFCTWQPAIPGMYKKPTGPKQELILPLFEKSVSLHSPHVRIMPASRRMVKRSLIWILGFLGVLFLYYQLWMKPGLTPEPSSSRTSPAVQTKTLIDLQPTQNHKDEADCFQNYPSPSTPESYRALVDCVRNWNRHSKTSVRNHDTSNALSDGKPLILLTLLVHNRPEYLQHTLSSLEKVRGIRDAHVWLLVSLDGHFPAIEKLVNSITFCQVKMVYHPFGRGLVPIVPGSGSVHPNSGIQTEFQASTSTLALKFDWEKANDTFLTDVNLKQAAPKHHYWWLWNYIVTKRAHLPVELSRPYTVAFVEEDHMLAPDFLEVLQKTQSLNCTDCFAFNLGHHSEPAKVTVKDVEEGAHLFDFGVVYNIGLVFTDASLQKLVKHGDFFCGFDEYNWDLTMNRMSQLLLIGDQSLRPRISRVAHIGYMK